MKKPLLTCFAIAIAIITTAQNTGIGTAAPQSKVDITASNPAAPTNQDGILIPRINIFPTSNPTANQNGMMVYLTTTVGTNLPGFYYWEQSTLSWKGVGGNTGWGLKGNAGTTSANNFIGTIDNNDVVFKRNNQNCGILGNSNTSFGFLSNNSAGTGIGNSAFGNYAMLNNTTGSNNTAIGTAALTDNSTGFGNVASGSIALFRNTTGSFNTANGAEALRNNISGDGNTANGYSSMFRNTTGFSNTASGVNALFYNSTGNRNSGYGTESLFSNTTGSFNTANGYHALFSNTTGFNNTASGVFAMDENVSGNNDVANGFEALKANTTGSFNTAIGIASLRANTTGDLNTATGSGALFSNISGFQNTAFGVDALRLNAIGTLNTAAGAGAMYNATGGGNTALGFDALRSLTTGGNNIGIGWNAQVPNPAANDQVRIGNTNITYAGIQVPWTITSDSRFKSNIQTSTLGLDFIQQLRPVSYYRNNDESKKNEYGFIAQEVEETLHKAGEQNNGIISKDDAGMYSMRYNDLIAPMVKAIQEQQATITALQKQNDLLLKRVELLENTAIKKDK